MVIVYILLILVSEEAYDDDVPDDGHYNKNEKVVPKKVSNTHLLLTAKYFFE